MNGEQKQKEKQKEWREVSGEKGGERKKRQNKQTRERWWKRKNRLEAAVNCQKDSRVLPHRQMTGKQVPRKQINNGTPEMRFRKLHLGRDHTVLISNWKSSSESLPRVDRQSTMSQPPHYKFLNAKLYWMHVVLVCAQLKKHSDRFVIIACVDTDGPLSLPC